MEDQGKRLLIAVVVAFGIMLAWSWLFPPEQPPEKPPEADSTAETAKAPEALTPATPTPGAPSPAPTTRGEERFYDLDSEDFHARFSSYDGALVSWTLKGDRLRNLATGAPEDMVRTGGEHRPLRLSFANSTFDIPAGTEWRAEQRGEQEIEFRWSSADLQVIKNIKLLPRDYAVEMTVTVELLGAAEAKQALTVALYSSQTGVEDDGSFVSRVSRFWKAACFQNDEVQTRSARSLASKGRRDYSGDIYWGGFDHAYFVSAVAIKDSAAGSTACSAFPLEGVDGGMGVELVSPSVVLRKGEPALKTQMVAYFGPKYIDRLEDIDSRLGYTTKLNESIDFGFFGILAAPLLSLLKWFQSWAVNWGLAIILLTLLVKGVTLPITHRSMKSMQAMSRLKPQLETLREKYKDDRQKLNVETMNLFKTHKVNPMGGCLPMLLQMPVWFALYRALTVAAELYQAPFIPGWMDDLTMPDPYYIMPVLLTGMMFLQTRLTPSTATGAQQKILTYGMPLMFGGFSLFFPAGLTLYIFTNTLLTAAHHLFLHKDTRREAKEKKLATPSGGSGGAEPSESKADAESSKPAPAKSPSAKSRNKKKRKR